MFELTDDNGLIATGSRETLCHGLENWFDGEESFMELNCSDSESLYNEDDIGNAMFQIRGFRNSDLMYINIFGFHISKVI